MNLSKETQERINYLFKDDVDMIERLYHLDADAIRNVGKMSQARMNPYDFVVAYESGSSSAMHCFYQQAKRLILLQELYKQLCFAYHENTTDISKNKARSNI